MRIGIYCRVSSLSQKKEGYSISNQRVRGIEYCDKMGYEYEIFETLQTLEIDHDPSGSNITFSGKCIECRAESDSL